MRHPQILLPLSMLRLPIAMNKAYKLSLWISNKIQTMNQDLHHGLLSLYELSDLNPAKLHMTVPTNFRRNSDIPGIVVLHYRDLLKNEIQSDLATNALGRCERFLT